MESNSSLAQIDEGAAEWGPIIFPKLAKVWQSGLGCDVILVCHDGIIQAPSALLSSLSKKLHQVILFSRDKRLTFKNISIDVWKDLLSWLYGGIIDNLGKSVAERVFNILYVSHLLDMKEIVDSIHLYINYFNSNVQGSEASETMQNFGSELTQDIQIEYNAIGNDETTKFVLFANPGLASFKNYLRKIILDPKRNKKTTNLIVKENEVSENVVNQNGITHSALHSSIVITAATSSSDLAASKITQFDNFPSKCRECHDKCDAKTVLCLYCNCIVPKDVTLHMTKEHGRCEKAQVWMYTCQTLKENKVGLFKMIAKSIEAESEEIFKCKICSDVYSDQEKMYFHMKNSHNLSSVFYCDYCRCGFHKASIRNYHQYLCGGGLDFKCKSCDFQGDFSELKSHMCDIVEDSAIEDDVCGENHVPRQAVCCNCNTHCSAEKVRCMLCFKIVSNDICHIEDSHPYTPQNSSWIYTCKFTPKAQDKVLFQKVRQGNKEVQYSCGKCTRMFPTMEKAKQHIKKLHKLYVKVCEHCETGLASFICHKDHAHFCGGGEMLHCEICSKLVGSYKNLADHTNAFHSDVSKKLQENSIRVGTEDSNGGNEVIAEADQYEQVYIGNVSCTSCKAPCSASRVQCIYCLNIVDNDPSHMSVCHPYTPENSRWMFSCNFEEKDVNGDNILCVREPLESFDEEKKNKPVNEFQYRCTVCNTVFIKRAGVISHVEEEHETCVHLCRVCDVGLREYHQKKDHEHYCSGGKSLSCDICNRFVGTYLNYSRHLIKFHPSSALCNHIVSDLKRHDPSRVLIEISDYTQRNSRCFECGENCKAVKVTCMYCFQVVENNPKHLDIDHPYTPKTCMWVYSCKSQKQSNMNKIEEKAMLSCQVSVYEKEITKEGNIPTPPDLELGDQSSDSVMFHRCCYCDDRYDDINVVLVHLKQDHAVKRKEVQTCEICNATFLNMSYWKDHFHFCSGGDLLKCDICEELVGGYTALDKHRCKGTTIINCGDNQEYADIVKGNINLTGKSSDKNNVRIEHFEGLVNDQMEFDESMPSPSHENKLDIFVEDKTNQTIENAKRCLTCGDNCASPNVQCLYCNQIVTGDDILVHVSNSHRSLSNKVIWPVDCTDIDPNQIPPIVTLPNDSCGKLVHVCGICNVDFERQSDIEVHCQDMHQFKVLFCNVCGSGFRDVISKNKHEYFCSGGDLLKCIPCSKLIGSWACANVHYENLHHPTAKYSGKKRKRIDSSMTERTVKKHKTDDDAEVVSKEIDNNFDGQKEPPIPNHIKKDSNYTVNFNIPNGIKLKCAICEFKTAFVPELSRHCTDKHSFNDNELNQICEFCFEVFTSRTKREKHEQSVHMKGQRVFCEICRRDFEIPSQKEIHVKYFHKNK